MRVIRLPDIVELEADKSEVIEFIKDNIHKFDNYFIVMFDNNGSCVHMFNGNAPLMVGVLEMEKQHVIQLFSKIEE